MLKAVLNEAWKLAPFRVAVVHNNNTLFDSSQILLKCAPLTFWNTEMYESSTFWNAEMYELSTFWKVLSGKEAFLHKILGSITYIFLAIQFIKNCRDLTY